MKNLFPMALVIILLTVFSAPCFSDSVPDTDCEKNPGKTSEQLTDYLERQKKSTKLCPSAPFDNRALSLFEKAQKIHRKPDTFLHSGTRNPDSIKYLEQAIDIDPHYHAAQYVLGLSYFRVENYEKAKKCFLVCLEIKPMVIFPFECLGDISFRLHQHNKAIYYYEKSNAHRENCYATVKLGRTYLDMDKLEKATLYFERALTLDCNAFMYDKDFAFFYLKTGKLSQSWAYLQKCVLPMRSDEESKTFIRLYEQYIHENNYFALISAGVLCNAMMYSDKAAMYLEKALELKPKDFDKYRELASSYSLLFTKMGMEKAFFYYEKAIKINPNDFISLMDLGYLLSEGGRWKGKEYGLKQDCKRARDCFEKAKKINPELFEKIYIHRTDCE